MGPEKSFHFAGHLPALAMGVMMYVILGVATGKLLFIDLGLFTLSCHSPHSDLCVCNLISKTLQA